MRLYGSQLRALVLNELRVEVRSRESAIAGLVFALLVLVVFSFAFDLRVASAAELAPGVLWVTLAFAGVLSLGRAFTRERDRRTLEALLLAPVDRSAIYLAKVVAAVVSMVGVALVAVPVFVALFAIAVDLPRLVGALLLGILGYAVVGTLLAAMAAHTRAREVMLPVLLFPIQLPLLLATVKATGAAIAAPGVPLVDFADVQHWVGLLVAFDLVFLGLSVVLFDYAIEE